MKYSVYSDQIICDRAAVLEEEKEGGKGRGSVVDVARGRKSMSSFAKERLEWQ